MTNRERFHALMHGEAADEFCQFEAGYWPETLERWRDHRGITQRGRKDGGSIPEYLDYPVKTPEDWQRIRPRWISRSKGQGK